MTEEEEDPVEKDKKEEEEKFVVRPRKKSTFATKYNPKSTDRAEINTILHLFRYGFFFFPTRLF